MEFRLQMIKSRHTVIRVKRTVIINMVIWGTQGNHICAILN